jgi:hypothetical protein
MKRLLVLIFAILLTLSWSMSGTFDNSDTIDRYRVARQIVTEGQIRVETYSDENNLPRFRDNHGSYVAVWGAGQSVFFLPFAFASNLVTQNISIDKEQKQRVELFLVSTPVLIICFVSSFLLCIKLASMLGFGELDSYVIAFIANFGSTFWEMAKQGQEEIQISILIFIGLYGFLNWKRKFEHKYIWLSAISSALALVFRPTAIPVLFGFFGLYCYEYFVALKSGTFQENAKKNVWSLAIAFGTNSFLAILVTCGYNLIKTGSILSAGNPASEFSGEVLTGLFEPTFGIDRGIIWTNLWILPCLIFTIYGWRKLEKSLKQLLLFSLFLYVSSISIYSKYNTWSGGGYGSRYQVHLVPLICLVLFASTFKLMQIYFPNIQFKTKKKLLLLLASVTLMLQIPSISLYMKLETFQAFRSNSPDVNNSETGALKQVPLRYANFFSKLTTDKVVEFPNLNLWKFGVNDWERATRWNYLPWLIEGRLSQNVMMWLRGFWVVIVIASIGSWIWVSKHLQS